MDMGFVKPVHPEVIVTVEKTGKEYKVIFDKPSFTMPLKIKTVMFMAPTTLKHLREHYYPVK